MSINGPAAKPDSVLLPLAEVYPQLYLTPGEEGARIWQGIVRRGEKAPSDSLGHFQGDPRDSVTMENTPAGPVQVVTLGDRRDFELFLQIMAFKCVPEAIPATQGASILDGVVNWTKIRARREEYLRGGGTEDGWPAEFRTFTSNRRNYTDALIVLSTGPYSAVPAAEAGMSEDEWLRASLRIRKAHECTHFICRRMFPEKIDPIWDELVADAAGLYAALGRYDLRLACLFLGVGENGYTGGRLENYAGEQDMTALAGKVYRTLLYLDERIRSMDPAGAFDLAVRLEDDYGSVWKKG